MKYVLALLIAAMSAPTFGTLTVPHTVLSADGLAELGLALEVRDIKDLVPFLEAPLSFTLTIEETGNCELDDVYIFVKDDSDNTIYGSSVALRGGHYHFQLQSNYSQYSTLSLVCKVEGGLGDYYVIELGHYVQSP